MSKAPKKPVAPPTFKERVGAVLPAVLWSLCHQHLREHGYTVREDMDLLVVRAMREAVAGMDQLQRDAALDRAAEEASQILRGPSLDSAVHLWGALAHATLAAAQRGVSFPENILLVASAVETEVAEFDGEFGGERRVQKNATLIDNVAWSRGWWRSPEENLRLLS